MELARGLKARVCMEASLKRGKSEAGMDASQVRTWEGWHHHMLLALIAVFEGVPQGEWRVQDNLNRRGGPCLGLFPWPRFPSYPQAR